MHEVRLLKMAYEAVDSRLKALISSEEMKWSFDSLLRKKICVRIHDD